MNWDFEISPLNSQSPTPSTPRKKLTPLQSTRCLKSTSKLLSLSSQLFPISKPMKRSPDIEVQKFELQNEKEERRGSKRLKIDKPPYYRQKSVEIMPFSFESEDEQKEEEGNRESRMEVEEEEEEMVEKFEMAETFVDNIRPITLQQFAHLRPTVHRKHSITQSDFSYKKPTCLKLKRSNSALTPNNPKQILQFLGDNSFIRHFQQVTQQSLLQIPKYQIFESTRFSKDYYLLQNMGPTQLRPGRVYKCLCKLDRMVYIIKQYHNIPSVDCPEFTVFRTMMRTSIHDKTNTVSRFYCSWFQSNNFYMVYESSTFSLDKLNQQHIKLTEQQIRVLLDHCCKALDYLNKNQMNHLNIKPSNIMNCRGQFKLIDHVASKYHFKYLKEYKNRYMAPELHYPMLVNSHELWKADVFALGMVLIENMVGLERCAGEMGDVGWRMGLKRRLVGLEEYSSGLKGMLLEMTEEDMRLRPRLEEIVGVKRKKEEGKKERRRKYSC